MATTTGLLSAAARRFSRSTSSIVTREVSGCHDLTISGCTATRKLPQPWYWPSKNFEVGSCSWRIRYQPSRKSSEDETDDGHISLYLEHDHADTNRSAVAEFTFTLLDQSGNPVPEYSRSSSGLCGFHGEYSRCHGFEDFIKWKDLEESGCLKDGRFAVRCDIVVIERSHDDDGGGDTSPAAGVVVVPPSNLHEHLNDLLWKKQGTDVTIDVGGETFNAHGWLLAVRSPVFEAELLAAAKEKVAGGGVRRRMEIQGGMDARVFEVMLHFMYTDTLPDAMEEEDDVEMARGLLEAAHRYKLERLKLMCEEMLYERIDLNTVAATLAVAEQNDCRALKAACVEFIARPGNLKAVMETEGFEKIKAKCPAVLMELVMKQLA